MTSINCTRPLRMVLTMKALKVGRDGVKYYNELGYVPFDVKKSENAAKTLEYAYDDFAIYQLGQSFR
jgi:putative alpha-1,2-mannosidase